MGLRIGDVLHEDERGDGFCGGYFGRDSYDTKRVEYIAADWVVVRNESGGVEFYAGNPEDLVQFVSGTVDGDDRRFRRRAR